MRHRTLHVAIALATLVATVCYPVAAGLLGTEIAGYSHVRDHISELGQSTLPTAQALRGILLANCVLVLGLAWSVREAIGDATRHPWAHRLIALFAFSLAIGGLFPCDADCRPTTLAGLLHVLNALPAAIATVGAPLAMARRMRPDPRLRASATLCLALAALTIAALVAAILVFPRYDMEGLGQRILLMLQLGFYQLVAVSLLHVTAGAVERPTPSNGPGTPLQA